MTVPFGMGVDNMYSISRELCLYLEMSTFWFIDVSVCLPFD